MLFPKGLPHCRGQHGASPFCHFLELGIIGSWMVSTVTSMSATATTFSEDPICTRHSGFHLLEPVALGTLSLLVCLLRFRRVRDFSKGVQNQRCFYTHACLNLMVFLCSCLCMCACVLCVCAGQGSMSGVLFNCYPPYFFKARSPSHWPRACQLSYVS